MIKAKKLYIVNWILEIILLITLIFIYYLVQPLQTSKVLYIPSGSISAIITHLKAKKISFTAFDMAFLRLMGSPQQGWIYLGEYKMNHGDFLYKLTTAKAAMEEITLIPGETTYEFFRLLAQRLDLNADILYKEFLAFSYYEDVDLVPDTYKLPIGI